MNPRIQVEHTVTEEITDVDLVPAQLRIAAGETLRRPGPAARTRCTSRGAALQCRITTEDPANGFRPDTGRDHRLPLARRRGRPARRRHDISGAEISAHFDSMLVKLTCRGRDFADGGRAGPVARSPSSGSAACRRTSRSCRRCVDDPDFRAGRVTTSFIDERPVPADRAHARPTAAPRSSTTSPTSPSTSRTGRVRRRSYPQDKLPAARPRRAAAARVASSG